MFGLPKFGDGVGLHRILGFVADHPDNLLARQPAIVVVGSKGKGSTALITAALLEAQGRRVGCFTSPHLYDVRERFRIGSELISRADFERLMAGVLAWNARRPDGDRLGAFEALFLVGLQWFSDQACDVVVWEAGIGGRYDPVRTLLAHHGALTSVELEHTELLGATRELIGYDKLDAFAPGAEVIVSASVPRDLRPRLDAVASLKSVLLMDGAASGPIAGDLVCGAEGTDLTLAWPHQPLSMSSRIRFGLVGRHQIANLQTALLLARTSAGGRLAPDSPLSGAEAKALANLRIEGRMERIARSPDLWIDVAHTPESVAMAADAFLEVTPRDQAIAVFGASANKNGPDMARAVAARFDRVVLTRSIAGGADPATFLQVFEGTHTTLAPDLRRAADLSREEAAASGKSVLVLGGLFLAAEMKTAWSGGDPGSLERI